MLNAYRKLFTAPGSTGFVLAGLLARLPLSMTGIGLITMLSQQRGAYTLAGMVSACFALSIAVLAPRISALVDRYGQFRVLPFAAASSALSMLALLACAHWQGPDWLLLVLAAAVGSLPSMPAMVRARWTAIYSGTPQLQTAFALEGVLDDLAFIVGPPLSVGLSMLLFPEAGPLAAALFLIIGVGLFVVQRRTEPPVSPHAGSEQGRTSSMLRQPVVRTLALFMLAQGVIVGVIDVASVAFATAQGQPGMASVVLSFYALGSCAMGLLFGTLRLQMPLSRQIVWVGASVAISALPLLLASNLTALTLAVLLAGITFGPTITVAMSLVEQQVQANRLTEGMTWLLTGLASGVALGAAAAGWLIDHWGAQQSFVLTLLAGGAMWLWGVQAGRQADRASAPGMTAINM
ncbi:MFS transporter [Comamonas sp. AG1104]|uniref:MFS transporter n=1 Tax=Comamonas sp. AG1104 TaxID=2183900 RepID=UPI000E0AC8F4|nr:MFS transporter [Comamonas sp. AG1104]RDI09917.1 putative MFS family arabinose efflux permease [Comamonas sp. AG1104]